MKRMLRFISAAFTAIVLLALLVLWNGIPVGFVIASLQERIEREIGYRLRIDGETKVGFWPAPTVLIGDVSVLDADDANAEARFKAASVRISLSFATLVGGPLHITEIAIVRPAVRFSLARQRSARPTAEPAGTVTAQTLSIDRIK